MISTLLSASHPLPIRRSRQASRRLRDWIASRHSLRTEAALIVGFYAAYEAARGLVVGGQTAALRRAHEIIRLEHRYHLFAEARVQHLAREVPGLLAALGVAYLTLHLAVTAAALLWLHRRRPLAFPVVRTTLMLASVLSLIGFLLFPTAPPRLAGAGLTDTVSHGAVSLNHGLVSALYNPYAAVPSLHAGYALVVGVALIRYGRSKILRVVGLAYPPFVLLVIVATGNHFFFDAVTGAVVAAAGLLVTLVLRPRKPQANGGTIAHLHPLADQLKQAA